MVVTDTTVAGDTTSWAELVDQLPVGLLVQDECGTVLAGNALAGELLGVCHRDLLTGRRPPGWLACDDAGSPLPDRAELAGQVLRTDTALAIPVLVSRHGVPHVRLWVSYHPMTRGDRPRLLVVLRPVHTEVGHAYGLLDPLTGLPNRALLLDRLDQALIRARTQGSLVSVVMLDIAGMAAINASFGFPAGDDLLVLLAGRLRAGLRADHTVARHAGNRFAVLAEHGEGTGDRLARRIGELIGRSARIAGVRLRPSARMRWLTSDGHTQVHTVIARLESRLAR